MALKETECLYEAQKKKKIKFYNSQAKRLLKEWGIEPKKRLDYGRI
jgi:transposase